MNFEVIEHTADIGFRAWGASFEQLLVGASQALVSIAMDLGTIEPAHAYPIAAAGEDRESLLVNWLSEVLYYLDGQRVALARFEVHRFSESEASGLGWGEPRQPRHEPRLIVKGVTYHQLRIACENGKWVCEVYLDV
ncbi:MAG: archease [Bryobacteraceae bacterium]|nr:archease [Bryobacteraceae bacterium]MDW8379019.1 archease [Bryobacterales bacterium]